MVGSTYRRCTHLLHCHALLPPPRPHIYAPHVLRSDLAPGDALAPDLPVPHCSRASPLHLRRQRPVQALSIRRVRRLRSPSPGLASINAWCLFTPQHPDLSRVRNQSLRSCCTTGEPWCEVEPCCHPRHACTAIGVTRARRAHPRTAADSRSLVEEAPWTMLLHHASAGLLFPVAWVCAEALRQGRVVR